MKNLDVLTEKDYDKILLGGHRIIDVRAPIEFNQGSFAKALNAPVLNDQERDLIGKTYKQKGSDAAIQLGYQIVSGENLELKRQKWIELIRQIESQNLKPVISCFRGGLRSQTTQKFLAEVGVSVPRVQKGYKHYRRYMIDQMKHYAQTSSMRVLTGLTGSAKTHLIKKIASIYPAIDLEEIARHRGSAFGKMGIQPAQAQFENDLTTEIFNVQQKFNMDELNKFLSSKKNQKPILFEDESRVIGSLHLTEDFFLKLRASSVMILQVSLEDRVKNIFTDYILQPYLAPSPHVVAGSALSEELLSYYRHSLKGLEKRLGGAKLKDIMSDFEEACRQSLSQNQHEPHKVWIEKMLVHYYDRMYKESFERRNPHVEFRGSAEEITDFLKRA